ncbi:MAG: ATP-binding cassette domain-containing protein [Polyangiaceae bacterium]|nr:ATP-binding cassette domain-containing protein [Polyangiaceae bacterium]
MFRRRPLTPADTSDLVPPLAPDDHVAFDRVTKSFGEVGVLKGIDIRFKRHETAVIIGGSGAGKTTLLRLLIGLDRPTAGRILVDGIDISRLGEVDLNRVRRKFGMVFQYAALLDSLTVLDNVAFPLREHRKDMSRADVRDKVVAMLNLLGLYDKEGHMPSELSGGQRKRVGLARALMLEPEVLVYDEPTSGLDPHTSRMVDDLIEETRSRFDVTSIVISHDMASAFRIAHHVYLLIDGAVAAAGTPEDLAFGANDAARAFIAASGVASDQLERIAGGRAPSRAARQAEERRVRAADGESGDELP